MKLVAPDPTILSTAEPQEVAGYGVFPRPLAGDARSAKEWAKIIAEENLPLVIVDEAEAGCAPGPEVVDEDGKKIRLVVPTLARRSELARELAQAASVEAPEVATPAAELDAAADTTEEV